AVEDFRGQFAAQRGHIHEQVLPRESHQPGRQGAGDVLRFHRSEAVPAQNGEADVTGIGVPGAVTATDSTDVEVQLVVNDKAATAGRLDVAPVPRLLFLGDGAEGPTVRTRPEESVPAEPDTYLVDLRPIHGLTTPDGKQAEKDTFVCHGVEVVKLRRHEVK